MRTNPVNLRLTEADLEAIGEEEGWVGYAYDDADKKAVKTPITEANAHTVEGTLTIGYGHTRTVKPGMRIDRAQGMSLLRSDVRDAESCVHRFVKVPLTPGEFVGMVDLFYNVGPGRMKGSNGPNDPGKDGIACLGKSGGGRPSTLLTLLNKCEPHDDGAYLAVAGCFTQWVMPGSIFEWGLTKRRIRMMLRFMGLPTMRAELAFPNVPVASSMRYDLMQRSIALAREEAADIAALKPPPKPAATVTIITDQPASSMRVDDKGGEAPVIPNPPVASPAPSPKPAATVSGPVAGPAVEPKAAPSGSPPTHPGNAPVPKVTFPKDEPKVEKPKEPVIITPKSIDPNAINYGQVDIDKGAKNMTDSRRFVGLLVVGAGSLTQVVATRYAVTNVMAGVFYDLSRDPIIVSLIAAGVIWLIGSMGKFGGRKTTTKGFVEAEQVLK